MGGSLAGKNADSQPAIFPALWAKPPTLNQHTVRAGDLCERTSGGCHGSRWSMCLWTADPRTAGIDRL